MSKPQSNSNQTSQSTPPAAPHPNSHLALGRGHKSLARRQSVLRWLRLHETEPASPLLAEPARPLTFSQIAELEGVSVERVRQLAGELLGVTGRGGGRLRGKRRWAVRAGAVPAESGQA